LQKNITVMRAIFMVVFFCFTIILRERKVDTSRKLNYVEDKFLKQLQVYFRISEGNAAFTLLSATSVRL
jgi:Na+/melibiose symporter-like transporter